VVDRFLSLMKLELTGLRQAQIFVLLQFDPGLEYHNRASKGPTKLLSPSKRVSLLNNLDEPTRPPDSAAQNQLTFSPPNLNLN